MLENTLPPHTWNYISTLELCRENANKLLIKVPSRGQTNKKAVFDVLKYSPLVREYDLETDFSQINFGDISISIPAEKTVTLQNNGYKNLEIHDIYAQNGLFEIKSYSEEISAMGEAEVELSIFPQVLGELLDTLVICSNDPNEAVRKIPVTASVRKYFMSLDNENENHYSENGEWHTSVTQAYGLSSRYSWLGQNPLAAAEFFANLNFSGHYDIEFIVPKTVNSTNHALYTVAIEEDVIDSVIIDQNDGSGNWIKLGRYALPADTKITLKIEDTGNNTNPQGVVLRADAVRFSLVGETEIHREEILTYDFKLKQNYPNPFNNSTVIQYSIPSDGKVNLAIFNLAGQQVDELVNEKQSAGLYKIDWETTQLSTGIYFYRLTFKGKSHARRMVLMK